MDQDSRSPEPRERAVSSEPCSTRPNPFDDGDSSSRKRRRTSLSGSRSSSVETIPSLGDEKPSSDSSVMRVDSPEQLPPSTPARPEPTAEPVSSKVTINLRNLDSLENTPSSPPSPTPAQSLKDNLKASVEEPEVNMIQIPSTEDASSSASELGSPEASIIPNEDDPILYGGGSALTSLPESRVAEFRAAMLDFPYHTSGESYHETVVRLAEYFRQQSSHVDDALHLLSEWLNTYLSYAHIELYPMVIEAYQENRDFWQTLPDLFFSIGLRHGSSKSNHTRDIVSQMFAQIARLTRFLIVVDCRTLLQLTKEEGSDFDLISPNFLRLFGNITSKEENNPITNGYISGTHPGVLEPLDILQSRCDGLLAYLHQFTELITSNLIRFPKKVMDNLVGVAWLTECLLRDSHRKLSPPNYYSPATLECSRKNMVFGLKFFVTVSEAMDIVIEKFINNLGSDTAMSLINSLTSIFRSSLFRSKLLGDIIEAAQILEDHREMHPDLQEKFRPDALSFEWRMRICCKLVKSRQMQLRVAATAHLCEDLVMQWRSYMERQDPEEEYLAYLRYLSRYLVKTGIVDYLLGPTCHPEITQTSFNIVGFLAVNKTYTAAQTELLWQTLTSTQDPRISDAIVRMMSKVVGLLEPDSLMYMCEKFYSLPIESFSSSMRDLFDQVTKQLQEKMVPYQLVPLSPYKICVRLLQESSILGPQGSVLYPEIHNFALSKFGALLPSGPDPAGRENIWMSCVNDIAAKSRTTSGSLQVLSTLMGNTPALQMLITDHNLTRLLVDELESTIANAKGSGFAPVYASQIGHARRRIISAIIVHYGSTIDSELGRRLWDLLVGDGAACQDDRKAAWDDLNGALKRTHLDNPFLNTCLREYLPQLPPSCYCAGSLSFVREAIIPLANDANGMALDDEDSIKSSGLELLWQMILTAPCHTIEETAISTLVDDIYVDSKTILSYPLHRARRVHFALAQRCLQQLKCAAQRLKRSSGSKVNGHSEPVVTEPPKEQYEEHELQFTRSLQVLIALLKSLQTRPHFAAPDLRSLMLQAPSPVDGEFADLKYQSFDGDDQTEIKSLNIGLKNTAASLLASLREATGFDNYRLYYRGQPLAPSESAICKSIEELDIKTGLILVKKETGITTSPRRIKPGASPLDIEILSHFKDLWEYLSMEEKLAKEIYHFLVSLPADDSILTAFEDPATSYRDVFPLGQPFKSLYALHALREYLSTRRLKSNVMQVSSQDCEAHLKSVNDHQDASAKAMSLVIAAICDYEVLERGSSEALKLKLSLELVDNYIHLLEEIIDAETITQLLSPTLLERLSTILIVAASAQTNQVSIELITRSFEALLESCKKSEVFWKGFRDQVGLQKMVQRLVLDDPRPIVRKSIAGLITAKSLHEQPVPGAQALDFAELFWPLIFQLVHQAVTEPNKCEETFSLSFQLLHKLNKEKPGVVDLPTCLRQCGKLLLSHTTTEDIAHPDRDIVAYGLIMILSIGMAEASARKERVQFDPTFTSELFSRHLFPPEDEGMELVPKVILNTPSRSILYDIILALVKDDATLSTCLLRDLHNVTSFRVTEDGMDTYRYDLPQLFDRSNAIRSSCGYSGMRNLSNTCYLNSLFTQLFMNVGFRRFILERRVRNPLTHSLLQETQALFAFLQDSRRRFVEPAGCVGQIMTYDEAPIDIHNQMDVDEFYSLLFDRWEAQLPLDADKKKLRSFYGGELVQQVKSKECQHISERIEPFSAIQCDIKGKAGLEESLQAYVDGEIMEGDNKYKCSDCDRHVDAVKRACLKDIPDNLIFHLKRFDFNLRTLTRSKINDYFPFPNEINMQPYTIEHLSDPSGSTEPDMFELVGILVHSGTAESGHYYSYIRERPTSSSKPSWVEFNDELVTSWEPSQMENACFGGPDYRPQFEAGAAYEKVYSAYMLFYQRSTSLQKEQEMLKASGQVGPFRCSVPRSLQSQVKEDNWSIVQRHCLYDPAHMPFVHEVLTHVWSTPCSKDHLRENLAMQTALGHLDQIASRAKDLPDYDQLKHLLVKACQRCPTCCLAFFDYFNQHKDALRMLLQRNSDLGVRQDIGKMLIYVLLSIKAKFPEEYGLLQGDVDMVVPSMVDRPLTIVDMTLDIFLYVWETFHTRLNSWPEYFGTMLEFARMGRYETLALLDRDFLVRLIMIISVDQVFDLPPQYARLLTVVSRRSARPPNYEKIIALINKLMAAIDSVPSQTRHLQEAHGRLLLGLQGEPVTFTVEECNILHRDWIRGQANVFTEKLISLNQNPEATDSIIRRLISFAPVTDFKVFTTLRLNITGELASHMVSPFLRVAGTYCRYSTNYENVLRLISHVSNQCRNLQNAEGRAFLEFQQDLFQGVRNTGETSDIIQLRNLENIPRWAPGLLGYIDHSVSDDVENFLEEKLFRNGPSSAFGEMDGALEMPRAIILVIGRLAVSCLEYLRDTYVSRAAQAAKYTVDPLDRVLKKCEPYFSLNEGMDESLQVQYMELRQVVLEPMVRLTVEEIEEDGSGMWSDSTTATVDYD
ncbi:uncharacterized protein F4812DRAFT_149220 [Daldinia caldariorum]|uniref:uncharacterized protein n=1 Tax=Daldinia caldariorum TaxID=326644 RepID=UPI0020087003|nr:uncharacterized protein F4812DRAFT_149220 [Daldinia caldariorum]KAI1464645.1 hypothetical protein F4812DRAFT_149220 [Daldinia caldariorum]